MRGHKIGLMSKPSAPRPHSTKIHTAKKSFLNEKGTLAMGAEGGKKPDSFDEIFGTDDICPCCEILSL